MADRRSTRRTLGTLCLPGTLIRLPISPISPSASPSTIRGDDDNDGAQASGTASPSTIQGDYEAPLPLPRPSHQPSRELLMKEYINKKVCILTTDGRTLIGTLLTADQVTNLVLRDTKERIIQSDDKPSFEVEHAGLYILRGDNVLVVGEVDVELDQKIDWTKVHGAAIGGIKHS